MFTFRTSITCAVTLFMVALAALLIAIQAGALSSATREAASAYMDAASTKAVGRLQTELTAIASLVQVLATSSSVADTDQRTEDGPAIPLFKAALRELPQMDSIYIGFQNGAWLQVRRINDLSDQQRETFRAPPGAEIAITLVRPTETELPMRRLFEDQQGNKVEQIDIPNYGYDPRKRPWYSRTLQADRPLVSSPYLSFTTGAPVITISAPLRGKVAGVLAADLKLDTFNNFVQAQRPGQHGIVAIFDSTGSLIAYPDLAQLIRNAMAEHPSDPQLPSISGLKSGVVAEVWQSWRSGERYEGDIRDDQGRNYLFRLAKLPLGELYDANILLLADPNDFVQSVRKLQLIGLILALVAGAAFVPAVWIFGSRMSRSLKQITAQAARLQMLGAPDPSPVRSYLKEINELGNTVSLAQRAIWSFARFVPKEIVRRVIDNSISTELGGVRQEITIVFTDVRDFTTIAESADADILMHQTSRYFSALTDIFLAEGGTVDKFIGDAVMVFWNAPNPQPDHVERACRAALASKAAGEKLNAQFEAEGLKPFFTRFGIHVGEAVVGNLGSTERMNYTALGNTVNLASRIEGLNKQFGTAILASEEVYSQVQHHFQFKDAGSVTAKGMTKETRVFELVGALA
jgi:adenylate cyclase